MKMIDGYMAGVNLGGWVSQYKGNLMKNPGKHFDTFVVEADIRKIADWGMDHVRLPFDYSLIEWDEEKGEYNELGFKYMDKCLEWCKKYGLNVIFDMHQAPGFSFGSLDTNNLFDEVSQQDRYVDIWKTVAMRYKDEGQNVVFELLNEIVEKTSERWNKVADRARAAIREIDKEHYIIIGGINYNSPWNLKDLPIFDDDKVIYNFHMYSPMQLTHQRAPWVADMKDYSGAPFVWPSPMAPYRDYFRTLPDNGARFDADIYDKYSAMDKNYISDFLKSVEEFQAAHDVPVYCGEYGVIELSDLESRTNWTEDMADYCLSHGIGRAVWTYRGMDFPLVDEDGNDIFDPLTKAAAKH